MIAKDGSNIWFYDWAGRQRTSVLVPVGDDQYFTIAGDGTYAGNADPEESLVYVVQEKDRQMTYTPSEFEAKYGLKNDPSRFKAFGEPLDDLGDNSERAVAEWVLSIGGSLELHTPAGHSSVDAGQTLPESLLSIRGIYFANV